VVSGIIGDCAKSGLWKFGKDGINLICAKLKLANNA
jgi:hypothetical protein